MNTRIIINQRSYEASQLTSPSFLNGYNFQLQEYNSKYENWIFHERAISVERRIAEG